MSSLVEAFPSLARELSRALRDGRRVSLAEQVDQAVIDRVTFDDSANAGYIYVRPSRDLNDQRLRFIPLLFCVPYNSLE
jgi:hypothetical protein